MAVPLAEDMVSAGELLLRLSIATREIRDVVGELSARIEENTCQLEHARLRRRRVDMELRLRRLEDRFDLAHEAFDRHLTVADSTDPTCTGVADESPDERLTRISRPLHAIRGEMIELWMAQNSQPAWSEKLDRLELQLMDYADQLAEDCKMFCWRINVRSDHKAHPTTGSRATSCQLATEL